MIRRPPRSTRFPDTTLFRSARSGAVPSDVAAAVVFLVGPWAVGRQTRLRADRAEAAELRAAQLERETELQAALVAAAERTRIDRKSTRLNSSHANISYAVFC